MPSPTNPKYINMVWPESEEWCDIDGAPGYQASSEGRIRSLLRRYPRPMSPEIDKDGYERVALFLEGKYSHKLVSRLVAQTFLGPAPVDQPMCCHRDNDKRNNRPENLRWDTQAANIADKKVHGTHQAGEKHPRAKITQATADEIRSLHARTPFYVGKLKDIASQTGASYQTVCSIIYNKAWRSAC